MATASVAVPTAPGGPPLDATRPPRLPLITLGLLSLVAFGSWFYGFGVLVEPIRADTGWAESALTTTYGASLLLTGVGSALGGHLIDRRGGRFLLTGAGLVAGPALLGASLATDPLVFGVLGVVGGGTIGATGYYQATQAIMGRLAPEARTRGITALTLWGAFASPVFLPLMGWGATTLGWRPTLRLVAATVTLAFLAAAASLPREAGPDRAAADASAPSLLAGLRTTSQVPAVRRLYVAAFGVGVGSSVLLLYQVPTMTSAGLALTTASGLAGARGVVQLGGRVPLPAVVRRTGSHRALRGSLLLAAVGAVILPFAGTLPVALVFTAVAGIAIGALAPLEGIYASDVADLRVLGTTMGVYSLVRGVGAALGPIVGGLLVDATGSRAPTLAVSAAALVAAVVVLRTAAQPSSAAASAEGP